MQLFRSCILFLLNLCDVSKYVISNVHSKKRPWIQTNHLGELIIYCTNLPPNFLGNTGASPFNGLPINLPTTKLRGSNTPRKHTYKWIQKGTNTWILHEYVTSYEKSNKLPVYTHVICITLPKDTLFVYIYIHNVVFILWSSVYLTTSKHYCENPINQKKPSFPSSSM